MGRNRGQSGELVPADGTVGGDGQRVDRDDPARGERGAEGLVAVTAQFRLRDHVLELHERPDVVLAGDRSVRDGERAGAPNRGMVFQRSLDARRGRCCARPRTMSASTRPWSASAPSRRSVARSPVAYSSRSGVTSPDGCT